MKKPIDKRVLASMLSEYLHNILGDLNESHDLSCLSIMLIINDLDGSALISLSNDDVVNLAILEEAAKSIRERLRAFNKNNDELKH